MGINSELYKNQTGIFYTKTTKNPPYCKFKLNKETQTSIIEENKSKESNNKINYETIEGNDDNEDFDKVYYQFDNDNEIPKLSKIPFNPLVILN